MKAPNKILKLKLKNNENSVKPKSWQFLTASGPKKIVYGILNISKKFILKAKMIFKINEENRMHSVSKRSNYFETEWDANKAHEPNGGSHTE